jgi:hypothetical protein
MTTLPLGLSYDAPEELYRSDPGLNQSLLKAFGRAKSPLHFQWEKDHPKEETDALRIGRFVDAAVLGKAGSLSLNDHFAVYTGAVRRGKEWESFKEIHAGKTILNESESERAVIAAAAVSLHQDAQLIFTVCARQVAVVAELPSIGRVKGLIDLLPDKTRCDPLLLAYIFDLKTSSDASPEGFARSCYDFGYDIQAALYMDALNACGVPVKNFGFIVVENKPPHQVAIHYFPRNSVEIIEARKKYEGWMGKYLACVAKGEWPGYGSEWTRIEYKPWQLAEKGWEREMMI